MDSKPVRVPKKHSAREFASSPKNPRFVHRKGLDDLFGPRNVSAEESRSLLVWDRMRALLSRSDSLLDAARGIQEASIVWKDLLVLLDRERLSDSKNRGLNGNCPPFVSELVRKESQGGAILGVPCGVVEGSSISVVGIPHSGRGSFEVTLAGLRVSSEMVPPVILHYNVNLPGENVTEEPFVVQNTWTDEYGWGRAERCPVHKSLGKGDFPQRQPYIIRFAFVSRISVEFSLTFDPFQDQH